MFTLLSDPKVSGALIAAVANIVAYFTKADPVSTQVYLTPVYVWILAHAHVQNGQAQGSSSPTTPAVKS